MEYLDLLQRVQVDAEGNTVDIGEVNFDQAQLVLL